MKKMQGKSLDFKILKNIYWSWIINLLALLWSLRIKGCRSKEKFDLLRTNRKR